MGYNNTRISISFPLEKITILFVLQILEENFLSSDTLDLIYETTFTVEEVEQALKYGTLLTSMISLWFIALILSRVFK